MSIGEKKRHYTIPIFIPMEACPFHCIFCDQEKISGRVKLPTEEDIITILERNLATISDKNAAIEVGFFGGTFTGLSPERQRSLLDVIVPFVNEGRIKRIRLSTRPDFITIKILDLLHKYPVTTIELGAQSMDDDVLRKSGRGHNSADTEHASRMILSAGFRLGLQMMTGLPGDSDEASVKTAERIIDLGASETRIYPVIVIKGTPLEDLYRKGKFIPLELEEAIVRTKKIVQVFERSDVQIIRIGLHPSEGLLSRKDYIAGPFHPSFRELVKTSIWKDRFHDLSSDKPGKTILIRVNPADLNAAIGYSGTNRKWLEQYHKVKFVADPEIKENTFHADHR